MDTCNVSQPDMHDFTGLRCSDMHMHFIFGHGMKGYIRKCRGAQPGAAASKKYNIGWRAALGHALLVDWMILYTRTGTEQTANLAANFRSIEGTVAKPYIAW